MNPRTVGALALRPVGNGQGSFYFLSVSTGRVLNRLHATALPMPEDIIDKVHRMARQQKNNPGLIFADRNLNPDEDDEDDDDDDETYHDDNDDDSNGDDNDDDSNGDGDEPHHHNDNNNDNDDESDHYRDNSDDDDKEDNNNDDDLSGDEDSVEANDDDANDGIAVDPPLNDIVGHADNPPDEIPGVGADEPILEDNPPLNDIA